MLKIARSCVKPKINTTRGAAFGSRTFSTTPRRDAEAPRRKASRLVTVPLGLILSGGAVLGATIVWINRDERTRKQLEGYAQTIAPARYLLQAADAVKGSGDVDTQSWTDSLKGIPDKVKGMMPGSDSKPPPPPKTTEKDEFKSLMRKKLPVPAPPVEYEPPKAEYSKDYQASVTSKEKTARMLEGEKILKEQEEKRRKEREEREQKERKEREERERKERKEREKQEFVAQTIAMAGDLRTSCEQAIEAHDVATKAIREHGSRLKQALDNTGQAEGVDGEWEGVIAASQAATEAASRAENLQLITLRNIEKIQRRVLKGKAEREPAAVEALQQADDTARTLKQDLSKAVTQYEKAQTDFSMVRDYRDLIKRGREQFKRELESLNPEIKLGKRFGGRLNEEELGMLIGHAHKRIEQLQNQLYEARALDKQRIEAAMADQRREDDKVADSLVRQERKRMLAELEREKVHWEEQALEAQEALLSQELARQEAAHTQHLRNALEEQQGELMQLHLEVLREKLAEQRGEFEAEIAGSIGRLRGIERAVEARASLEHQGRKAQELWLACQALATSIHTGKVGQGEGHRKPLRADLEAIREAGSEHPFVTAVLDAFPPESVTAGVWTEASLYDRFKKVYRVCRRVALVDERGGTLFKYFLSYLQSLLVFPYGRVLDEGAEITDDVSQFLLLDSARYYMNQGNLEMAVRFVNQLKGEARMVASDWLKEARLTLEAKQAARCLLAHSSASGLGAVF